MAASGAVVESLEEIPAHVWKGLPASLNLGPSAINQNRIGEFLIKKHLTLFSGFAPFLQ